MSPFFLTQLITSFPAGYVSDLYRRDSLLKLASIVGLLGIAVTVWASYNENYRYLLAALAVWGCFWGIANTSLVALFADSIPEGQRSVYFTKRSILNTIGNIAGPLVSLVMFAVLGDNWKLRDCAIVMIVGQAICFPAVVMLCFFRDDDDGFEEGDLSTLGGCTDCGTAADAEPLMSELMLAEEPCELQQQEEAALSLEGALVDDGEESSMDEGHARTFFFGCIPNDRYIATLVATADLIAGLGSGMSIRYFPIFFVDNLKLRPVAVQILYVIAPVLQASLMHLAQKLSKRFGRCHVTVALKWIGICFMFAMITAYMVQLPTICICVVYILRTAFMNSTGALTRSMLMDNVPKEERGKWSALESVNMFSWSGSAALGGVLVGAVGILPLFGITASIQLLATLVLVPLFSVDKEGVASIE